MKKRKEVKETCDKLMCGLVLNPEFAFNVLDRGPSADSAEVSFSLSVLIKSQAISQCHNICSSWHIAVARQGT